VPEGSQILHIHTALILRQSTGSPNVGPGLSDAKSQHADLADFSNWWLTH
jgi:hypothetical protein